jgi:hypothetical protein
MLLLGASGTGAAGGVVAESVAWGVLYRCGSSRLWTQKEAAPGPGGCASTAAIGLAGKPWRHLTGSVPTVTLAEDAVERQAGPSEAWWCNCVRGHVCRKTRSLLS